MDKKPLIPIDEGPLEVWYESPSVMVVKKPQGIKVYPTEQSESGTLLNRLFQHNRWLAQMETSISAGVLHVFEPQDSGLMLFNKSNDDQEALTKALVENAIEFSYSISIKGNEQVELPTIEEFSIMVRSQKQSAGYTIIDLTATSGNTKTIRDALFPNLHMSEMTFYCYQITLTLPHSGEKHTITLRDSSKSIPNITVYHAPP
jgi:23S rRNA-/tRNA-specific pseudouridylate synthase